jgi:ABC-type nitrate/sulfonate/bicarbonate transport system permease component
VRNVALRLAVLAGALMAWQLGTKLVPEERQLYFPAPSVIGQRMLDLWFSGPVNHAFLTAQATGNIIPSLERMLIGWGLAAVTGIAAGLALGRSQRALDYVDPLIHYFRAIPPPAAIPLFIILFKLADTMRITVIVFGVIWPILLNTIDGARSVEPMQLDTARVFGLTAPVRLFRIILPAAAPKIFAGLRVSLSLSLILMVVSELVGSINGIGYMLNEAKSSFELPDLWACIVLLGILGYAFNAAFLWIERHVLAWHRGARGVIE